jgi:alpha-glucosidase
MEFFKTSEPVLAFRRSNGTASIVGVFNLSAQPVRVTLTGKGAELLPISMGAELRRTRLSLDPNGFAFVSEEAESGRLDLKFSRRAKRKQAA